MITASRADGLVDPASTSCPHPPSGWPRQVTIWEVGPRDGLQNEAIVIPVATKVEFVRRLVGAGLRTVEATSFVNPSWVPQLADAEEVNEDAPSTA